MRTLPLEVGRDGVNQFDSTVWETIRTWSNDPALPDFAQDLARLPMRLGGLGVFDQGKTEDIAATASFLQSRGFLLSRSQPLSSSATTRLETGIAQCADNLNLPYGTLVIQY